MTYIVPLTRSVKDTRDQSQLYLYTCMWKKKKKRKRKKKKNETLSWTRNFMFMQGHFSYRTSQLQSCTSFRFLEIGCWFRHRLKLSNLKINYLFSVYLYFRCLFRPDGGGGGGQRMCVWWGSGGKIQTIVACFGKFIKTFITCNSIKTKWFFTVLFIFWENIW